jgi:hypothetical protein
MKLQRDAPRLARLQGLPEGTVLIQGLLAASQKWAPQTAEQTGSGRVHAEKAQEHFLETVRDKIPCNWKRLPRKPLPSATGLLSAPYTLRRGDKERASGR